MRKSAETNMSVYIYLGTVTDISLEAGQRWLMKPYIHLSTAGSVGISFLDSFILG